MRISSLIKENKYEREERVKVDEWNHFDNTDKVAIGGMNSNKFIRELLVKSSNRKNLENLKSDQMNRGVKDDMDAMDIYIIKRHFLIRKILAVKSFPFFLTF